MQSINLGGNSLFSDNNIMYNVSLIWCNIELKRGEPEQGYHFSGKPEYQQLHVPSMHPLQCPTCCYRYWCS